MKCTILHESRGRLRVHVCNVRMTLHRADVLEAYLNHHDAVSKAKVYERTGDVVVYYTGARKDAVAALSTYRFDDPELDALVTSADSRRINQEYQEKMYNLLAGRVLRQLFLPAPLNAAYTVFRSIEFLWKGVCCLWHRKLEVEVLDALSIGVSILRSDFSTAGSVMFLLNVGSLLEEWTRKKSLDDLARSMALNVDKVWVRAQGSEVLMPLTKVHPGDEIVVRSGNMIPLDGTVIEGEAMVNQAALTGESMPVRKTIGATVYAGTVVEEGECVLTTRAEGGANRYDKIVAMIEESEKLKSSTENRALVLADRLVPWCLGATVVTYALTRNATRAISCLMVDFSCALKLSMPLAVLSAMRECGASHITVKGGKYLETLSKADTIVFDKTGTLTQDKVVLEYHLNVNGENDTRVLRHAYLNSYFQTGYKNLMDLAIIHKTEEEEAADSRLLDLSENYVKVDEIPFDFTRRRLTTVVQDKAGKTQMVTKGAVEEMLSICTYAEQDGRVEPLTDALRSKILRTVDELNDKGFRVLAIAQKSNPSPVDAFGVKDERDMVLLGYLAFLDPPKESTADAIRALKDHGVTTKILTGDNDKVTRTICKQVGLKVRNMLLGSDLDHMSDAELARAAESTDVFAKLTPDQKARVVSVLRENGHTVGFMGDGINDAAAMKAADIGISVDTAVDVAKESADIILLEKDLMVLEQGIIEGRKTYANMIKYIKMTASSNFGNMFSVLAASALLPFLPMMSVHLIFLNLIYDLSCTAIPWDNVDEEFIAKPRKWDASSVGSFMIWIGPTSSIFDFTTYIFMYFVFCPLFVSGGVLFNDLAAHYSGAQLALMQAKYIGMFQAGWFVESMWSQTLVIHMIRTPKLPFIQSRASAPVTLLTMTGIAVLTIIPFTPFGTALGFVALPAAYFAYLIPCILLYMVLATSLKKAYVRHYGELL